MSHHFIRFENVCYTYTNGFEALKDISFTVTHGEHVALTGLNGSGKSTLLLHCNGLLLPTKGEVNIGDIPVCKQTLRRVRQSVGMVFQNPDDMLFMPTVEDDVAFGPINMGLPPEEVDRRVTMALRMTGCESLRDRAPFQLSGGQKRMAAIAAVLSMEPDILVLDEPTSNLDMKAREQLIEILQSFRHTILLATHDMDLVDRLCQRVICIDEGRIISDKVICDDRDDSGSVAKTFWM